MKERLLGGLIIVFSAYLGLLLCSLYLYFKYQNYYEEKKITFREEAIKRIEIIKANTDLKKYLS